MAKKKVTETAKIKVTLVKSTIAVIPQHKKIVEALGLKKVRSFRIHDENPCILGMIANAVLIDLVGKIDPAILGIGDDLIISAIFGGFFIGGANVDVKTV